MLRVVGICPILLRTATAFSSFANPSSSPRALFTSGGIRGMAMQAASPADLRPLELHVTPPPAGGGEHRATVIFLHGSGDSGDGVQQWVEAATDGAFSLPGVKMVFPTAHMRKYSLLGPHGLQRVWFDRLDLAPAAPEDTEGIVKMAQLVKDVVQAEVDLGIPLSKVIIGGFSMGGGMSLHTALRDPDMHGLGGVFALSTFFAENSPTPERVAASIKEGKTVPPVWYAHGKADPMVKLAWGASTAKRLEVAGVPVTYTEFPGLQHDLRDDELMLLKTWIATRLS